MIKVLQSLCFVANKLMILLSCYFKTMKKWPQYADKLNETVHDGSQV